jgi:transketolase
MVDGECDDECDEVVANTLKTLAMDAVQKANSGHPGAPMGLAEVATALWCHRLIVDPTDPGFCDRDRFVLSGGHGSMLLYGLLHLSGHDLSLDEIKAFRQLHSKTPGHPEVGLTPGVETTTGPLGQGIANAVGMAIAERFLGEVFNRDGFDVVDHRTYAICGDGDLQEGVSYEATAIAGHQALDKLTLMWDDNRITIDGGTEEAWSEDVCARFEAAGWHIQRCDGHDVEVLRAALDAAEAVDDRPSMIACRTHIGHGSPNKQDTSAAHGAPLGADEIAATKTAIGWDPEAHFLVPAEALAGFDALRRRGAVKNAAWQKMFTEYNAAHPQLAARWLSVHDGAGVPSDLDALLPDFADDPKIATRKASGVVLNAIAASLPTMIGGSADLAGSNLTKIAGEDSLTAATPGGRNMAYGIREHGMASVMNGMALHGGVIPYAGTFLTFSDYMRGAMRLSALMEQRVIYVLTHDSVFLGEDGPTHQAVEHAMALRLIPNMTVLRPADARETAAAWGAALRRTDGPTCLLLTRQGLPSLAGTKAAAQGVSAGAYTVLDCGCDNPELVLIGSGSEVHLCVAAGEALIAEGRRVRVISMPDMMAYLQLDRAAQDALIPPAAKKLAVEAGRPFGWAEVIGREGSVIGVDRFGESAPGADLAEFFGLNTAHVTGVARQLLNGPL